MIRFFAIFLFSIVLYGSEAKAQALNYVNLFDIDLDEEIPSLDELKKKYDLNRKLFDTRYDYHWSIGNIFDQVFRFKITSHGSTDKRVIHENEEIITKLLKTIPEEHYQYVGPYLHSVPNMPPKILNMPGIKETKNKFPTRIAKELEGIEDLEFVSPYMYLLLMPEVWPGYYSTDERRPLGKVTKVTAEFDPKFFENLKKLVPEENYVPGADVKGDFESTLRTINPTKTSPITAADVKAFANTIPDVKAWGNEGYRILEIVRAGDYLEAWEADQGKALPMKTLKATVNPCQRLVQKIRLAGMEGEFFEVVSRQGFTVNGWAYTCDKTIKAYRVATIPLSMIEPVMKYQKAIYDNVSNLVDDSEAQVQYAVMQSIAEMYRAPMKDVLEVRKEKPDLYKAFLITQDSLIDSPLVFYD